MLITLLVGMILLQYIVTLANLVLINPLKRYATQKNNKQTAAATKATSSEFSVYYRLIVVYRYIVVYRLINLLRINEYSTNMPIFSLRLIFAFLY